MLLAGCGNMDPQTLQIDFRQSSQGWSAGLADYPVGQDDFHELEIATRDPNGCAGVGGAPGEGVTVKAGASELEPESVMKAETGG